jgi:hypothetical protein
MSLVLPLEHYQIIYPEKNYYYSRDDKKLALRVDEINSNRLIVEKSNYYYNCIIYSPKIELFDSNLTFINSVEYIYDQATGFNVNKIFIDKLDANSLTQIGARKYFGRSINNNYSGGSASTLNIKDSNIFLTGCLNDLTLTNDLNVSGHGPFATK